MAELDSTINRSVILSDRIQSRTDGYVRDLVDQFNDELCFEPIDRYMISADAWKHVISSDHEPKKVFAHPEILMSLPETSAYYRNMAMLPLKRVSNLAISVERWETNPVNVRVSLERALRVARLYNAVNSAIIEGSIDWVLEDGYRNIIANMGIGLDGTMRNLIGKDADQMVKSRIIDWLDMNNLLGEGDVLTNGIELTNGYRMRYGSEPDVSFWRGVNMVSTIEIKGGRDPAGALERLGAARKSFENTPPGCVNFLVARVTTAEMRRRLDLIGTVRVFALDDVIRNGVGWINFLNEVFHHTVRITDRIIDDNYNMTI